MESAELLDAVIPARHPRRLGMQVRQKYPAIGRLRFGGYGKSSAMYRIEQTGRCRGDIMLQRAFLHS